MKPMSVSVLLLSTSLLTSLLLVGCASHGSTSSATAAAVKTTPSASNSSRVPAKEFVSRPAAGNIEIANLQQDAKNTRAALTRAAEALKRLQFTANPTEAYVDFSEKVAAFEELSVKTQFDSAYLQKRSMQLTTQWNAWSASFQDPTERAAADKRRVHLQDGYVYMTPSLIFAATDLSKVTASLSSLKTTLAPATTGSVLSANQALIEKALHQATDSIDSLRNLSDRLDLVAPDLAEPTVFTGKRPRS